MSHIAGKQQKTEVYQVLRSFIVQESNCTKSIPFSCFLSQKIMTTVQKKTLSLFLPSDFYIV